LPTLENNLRFSTTVPESQVHRDGVAAGVLAHHGTSWRPPCLLALPRQLLLFPGVISEVRRDASLEVGILAFGQRQNRQVSPKLPALRPGGRGAATLPPSHQVLLAKAPLTAPSSKLPSPNPAT